MSITDNLFLFNLNRDKKIPKNIHRVNLFFKDLIKLEPKSIKNISHSKAYKLWGLLSNRDWLIRNSNVQTFPIKLVAYIWENLVYYDGGYHGLNIHYDP